MNPFIQQNRFLLAILGITSLLIIVVVTIVLRSAFLSSSTPHGESPNPTVTPIPTVVLGYPKRTPQELLGDPWFKSNPTLVQSNPAYIQSSAEIDAKNKAVLTREGAVGRLLMNLPYTGQNFMLRYDYGANIFYLTLSKTNPTLGNQEFDAFLKANAITSRTWVKPLVFL